MSLFFTASLATRSPISVIVVFVVLVIYEYNSPFVTFMYTKLGDLFFSRGKFSFFAPEGLNLIQSVAILRSPSAARRSKGEARYQIHARRGKKTEFSPRKKSIAK